MKLISLALKPVDNKSQVVLPETLSRCSVLVLACALTVVMLLKVVPFTRTDWSPVISKLSAIREPFTVPAVPLSAISTSTKLIWLAVKPFSERPQVALPETLSRCAVLVLLCASTFVMLLKVIPFTKTD